MRLNFKIPFVMQNLREVCQVLRTNLPIIINLKEAFATCALGIVGTMTKPRQNSPVKKFIGGCLL